MPVVNPGEVWMIDFRAAKVRPASLLTGTPADDELYIVKVALEGSANLPAPEIIAQEITDELEAALERFATIAEDLKK